VIALQLIVQVMTARARIAQVVTGPPARDPLAATVLIAENGVRLPVPVAEGEKAAEEQAASISGARRFASSAPKK
jgi:hypothetical protein